MSEINPSIKITALHIEDNSDVSEDSDSEQSTYTHPADLSNLSTKCGTPMNQKDCSDSSSCANSLEI